MMSEKDTQIWAAVAQIEAEMVAEAARKKRRRGWGKRWVRERIQTLLLMVR